MAVEESAFDIYSKQQVEKQKQQNFNDLQDESVGRETGRQRRFVPEHQSDKAIQERKKKEEERTSRITLEMMMRDPEYAKLCHQTEDLLSRAEIATERVLREAEKTQAASDALLHQTLENANRLPSGEIVFKDKNGKVWTDKDERVDPLEAASVVWKEDSVGRETYLERRDAAAQNRERTDRIRNYQVEVLGDIRHRIDNNDGSVTKDDFTEMQKDILEQAPPVINAQIDPENINDADLKTNTFDVAVPKL